MASQRRVARTVSKSIMTRADHATGTDRLAEVATQLQLSDDEIVVNVQGDEPLIDPELVRAVADLLARETQRRDRDRLSPDSRATTKCSITNVVKVVLDRDGMALYFSRATIPHARDAFAHALNNVPAGVTTFSPHRALRLSCGFPAALSQYLNSPAIERFEALEQLRALWHGYKIAVFVTECDAGARGRYAGRPGARPRAV